MTTLDAPTSTVPDLTGASGADPEEVAARLIGILNDGAICALASLGHELGLFDTLASLPPVSSAQLADAAGLDERYVREWLGGVVTAGFVQYVPTDDTYRLRPDHAPFLTGGSPDNLARMTRYVALMGLVQPKVVEAFRHGGGPSYDDYPGFHDLMAAESAAVNDASLLDTIIPLTRLVDRLRAGIRVADLGCGEGHAINLLAREFPASTFTGLDFGPEAIARAREEAAAWGLDNATFVERDVATSVAEPGSLDLVTAFDAIHDQAHPATVLGRVREALRPDGTFLMVDISASSNLEDNLDLPWASFLYAISTTHCMSVSLAQGGDGLGTVWGVETAQRMLHEAGFADVTVHDLEEDPFNAYFVAHP
ncbi:transcriptional regulator [Nocardioides gansuensis]|uniref:Transcriptional regulator n=1 Tax=Nocardioides gansuensis TaxID=2138300 RepID=A0A2T8FF43_9ACTN|nr:methyltransferase domain-containing protein [Nocardioides gansuensis]PVG84341.1 transcriptional regulator [Nocardioides gansuensis]